MRNVNSFRELSYLFVIEMSFLIGYIIKTTSEQGTVSC